MGNLKKRICDWYDNIYYQISQWSVKRFWNNLRRWFSYYKVIRKTYDFDYSSLLEVELHQLIKLRDCISKYQNHVNAWRDIRDMNLAISCLQIVIEDGCAYSNKEKCFFVKGPDENGYYNLVKNPNHVWIMPIYVNTKNAERFWKYYNKCSNINNAIQEDHLRIEKAWYLYNKIRKERLRNWWD